MIGEAVSLALLTTTGFTVVYKKLPRRIRRFCEKHQLLTEVSTLLGVYLLLGGTLTAMFAGAASGLLVSIMLHIANNPEDYEWLTDLADYTKTQLKAIRNALQAYGAKYRAQKQLVEA